MPAGATRQSVRLTPYSLPSSAVFFIFLSPHPLPSEALAKEGSLTGLGTLGRLTVVCRPKGHVCRDLQDLCIAQVLFCWLV